MGTKNHVVAVLLSSPLTMVAAALSDSVTTPPNSSIALTSVAVTTTLESSKHLYNSTGYLIEQDELEYSILAAFSDMQTVLVACISTLLPLILVVAIAFGMRHAWRKYRHRRDMTSDLPWYHGVPTQGNTAESFHRCTNSANLGIQPATRILSAHDLADGLGGSRVIHNMGLLGEKVLAAGNNESSSPVNHLCKNRNGSIITLKLQKNDIMVETTERLVSMDDNSFVVEMEPKCMENKINIDTRFRNDAREEVTDQLTWAHFDGVAGRSTEFGTTWRFGGINTGLSQSDSSISSYGSLNRGYCYGNQVEYETGQFDYSFAPAIENDNRSRSRKLDVNSKWVIFENTPAAGNILLNGMAGPDSIGHINSNTKINETHNSLNPSRSAEREERTVKNNAPEILKLNQNRIGNCATPVELKRTMSHDLIDECVMCEKPVITAALLEDETRKTIKLREEHQYKRQDSLQQSKNLDGDSLTLEQCHMKVHERKIHSTELVSSDKKSDSTAQRLMESNLNIDRTRDIDIHDQLKTQLLSELRT